MIRATVHDYRAQARQALMDEFPSIKAEVDSQRLEQLHQVSSQETAGLSRLGQGS